MELCAVELRQDGLARLPGAASALADCSSMLATTVSRWRGSDECRECRETGSDCDKCAMVAKGGQKGTYSGGVSSGGNDDVDISDDDMKDMEDFFKNDPIFSDPTFRDEFFKDLDTDVDVDEDYGKDFPDLILPPGIGQPPWVGKGRDDLPPPLPPTTAAVGFQKFEREMSAAVEAIEEERAAGRRRRRSGRRDARLPSRVRVSSGPSVR